LIFLEQRINIKFYVKLEKNERDTWLTEEKLRKSHALLTAISGSKTVAKKSKMTMLITFFDTKGVVHFEFIPQVQTVNGAYYVEILKRLREAVHRKSPISGPTSGSSP
jgi:hypothetical protein